MLENWQWLLFVNVPCLFVNLAGIYLSVFTITDESRSRFCFNLNAICLVITILNIGMNSFGALGTYYQWGGSG